MLARLYSDKLKRNGMKMHGLISYLRGRLSLPLAAVKTKFSCSMPTAVEKIKQTSASQSGRYPSTLVGCALLSWLTANVWVIYHSNILARSLHFSTGGFFLASKFVPDQVVSIL